MSGSWTSRGASPAPFAGAQYFFAGVSAQSELRQDVSVQSFAPLIDAGQQSFFFEGYVQSFQQSPLDAAEIIVEYRDASNTAVLSSYDAGQVHQANNWLREADARVAPVGTRWIRVRLIATRAAGDNNDGYFDGLSLRAGNTGSPPFSTDHAGSPSPPMGHCMLRTLSIIKSSASTSAGR